MGSPFFGTMLFLIAKRWKVDRGSSSSLVDNDIGSFQIGRTRLGRKLRAGLDRRLENVCILRNRDFTICRG
jgi:hypothetical protein